MATGSQSLPLTGNPFGGASSAGPMTRGKPNRAVRGLSWLIAAYVVVAPMSIAGDFPINLAYLKALRIGMLGLICILGFSAIRVQGRNQSSNALFLLALLFTFAAAWSDNPTRGFLYKGLFLAACVAGIGLGNRIRSERDVNYFLECFVWVGLGVLAAIGAAWFTGFAPMYQGRLVVAGINPNSLGQLAALFFVQALFFFRVSPRRKRLAAIVMIVMIGLTALTGSRGAFLIVAATIGIVAVCHYSRSDRFFVRVALFLTSVGAGIVLFLLTMGNIGRPDSTTVVTLLSDDQKTFRLRDEMFKNNRAGVWRAGGRRFKEKPIIGWGWKNYDNSWEMFLSAYLQIAVEMGLLGVCILAFFLVKAWKAIAAGLSVRRYSNPRMSEYGLFFSIGAVAMLMHGLIESSMIIGTTPNPVVLMFSLYQLDRMITSGVIRPRNVIR